MPPSASAPGPSGCKKVWWTRQPPPRRAPRAFKWSWTAASSKSTGACWSAQILDFQLIARLSAGLGERAGRQFQHGVRREAPGDAPRRHFPAHFLDLLLPVEIDHVDRELHEKAVNRLARHDPQPVTRFEVRVFKKARAPLGAGVGDLRPFGQDDVPCKIAHLNFQIPVIARGNKSREVRYRTTTLSVDWLS